jgi:hypothetical protein
MFGFIVVFVFFSIVAGILKSSPILRALFSLCLLTIIGIIGYAEIDIHWIHPEQYNKSDVTSPDNYIAPAIPTQVPAPRHQKKPYSTDLRSMPPAYQQCVANVQENMPWIPNRDHTGMLPPGKADVIEAVHSSCDKLR